MSIGLQLIASSVLKGEARYINELPADFFKSDEATVLAFVKTFLGTTGEMPKLQTITVETGVDMPTDVEPPEFYVEKVKTRYKHQEIKRALIEADELLKKQKPDEAMETVLNSAVKLLMSQDPHLMLDFATTGLDFVVSEYKKKLLLGDDYGVMLGWPTLDYMIGGLVPGDILAIVGRPASGKTYLTLFAALYAWSHGKNVLYVSTEMKPLPILQRAAAMHLKVPVTELKKAGFSSKVTAHFAKGVHECKVNSKSKLWVLDGKLTSSIENIAAYAKQLKADLVVVDGAYLLRGSHPKMALWERVTETTEGLKSKVAQAVGVPVIASYQLNRQSTKKKAGTEGLEDIGYTDAIGQIASVVLGLFQEETIETVKEKKVRIMKGREGETGEFDIHWIFDNSPFYASMNFNEITKDEKKQKDDAGMGWV